MSVSEDPKTFGSASKPLKLKCSSVGKPTPDKPYICYVLEDGTQIYLGLTFGSARLVSAQLADAVASWPVEAV